MSLTQFLKHFGVLDRISNEDGIHMSKTNIGTTNNDGRSITCEELKPNEYETL